MSNKICFIEPPYNLFMESLDAPFMLMCLAGVAEQVGWEPSILDMKNLDDSIPEADVYAVTSSSPQWPVTVKLSKRLAEEFPSSVSIVGGNHVSAEPESFDDTYFKVAVAGEGEQALANILYNIDSVKCRLFMMGSPVEDLDSLPFPSRHLVDWGRYKRGIYWGKEKIAKAVSMITSRGCPFNCVFCGSHVVFGRRTRFRSISNVVSEIKHVIDVYGFRGFNFHDDTFSVNKRRVYGLCEELHNLDVVWRCLTRVDRVDSNILNVMGYGGCREIILGVESGSQKILDLLNKGVTVEQNLKAMKLIKANPEIQLKTGIIVGSPGESYSTVEETKKLIKACPPDFWNVNVFTPFPGSYAWHHPEKLGLKILSRNLEDYAMVGDKYRGNVNVETEHMSKSDIEQARDELIDLLVDVSGHQYEF